MSKQKLDKLEIQKEFKINKYITLKLIENETFIFILDNVFKQCKYLLFNIPKERIRDYDQINSIDEMEDSYSKINESSHYSKFNISPEQEFMAHSSNLQVWCENDYDTRLLHRNLAFPLLRELSRYGDSLAKKKFKEEIALRIEDGNENVLTYLLEENYMKYFTLEEIKQLLNEEKYPLIRYIYRFKDIGFRSVRIKGHSLRFEYKDRDFVFGDHTLRIFSDYEHYKKIMKDKYDILYRNFSNSNKRYLLITKEEIINKSPLVNIKNRDFYDLTYLLSLEKPSIKHFYKHYDLRLFISRDFIKILKRIRNIEEISLIMKMKKRIGRNTKRLELYLVIIANEGEEIIYEFKLYRLRRKYFRNLRRNWLNRYIREHHTIFNELWQEFYFQKASKAYELILNKDLAYSSNIKWRGDKRLTLHINYNLPYQFYKIRFNELNIPINSKEYHNLKPQIKKKKQEIEKEIVDQIQSFLRGLKKKLRKTRQYIDVSCHLVFPNDLSYIRCKVSFSLHYSIWHFKTRLLDFCLSKFGKVVKLLKGKTYFDFYSSKTNKK